MNLFHTNEHTSYCNLVSNLMCGFKLISSPKDETFSYPSSENNNIIFVSEGEIEISYNEFSNHKFQQGTIIFIPKLATISGKFISNCKLTILQFNIRLFDISEKYILSQYSKYRDKINYNFQSIAFKGPITNYLQLLETYIKSNIFCVQMHEIKLEELFIIFKNLYNKEEMATFFYPMLGEDIDFKSTVLEKCRMEYNIKEMAEALSMHEKYFPKKFKKEFGISFHQWKLKQKATQIKYKISVFQPTIKDLISEFEFSNFAHFNRFCKKQYNCTPTELLKKINTHKSEN